MHFSLRHVISLAHASPRGAGLVPHLMSTVAADTRNSVTVEEFFEDAPAPTSSIRQSVEAFIQKHRPSSNLSGRPIVCVTSGGTTVPLERRCIRFIDNFSGGTRGALSVEEFLEVSISVSC